MRERKKIKPFVDYPLGGYNRIGSVSGSNCRHGYGRDFMLKTGQTKCAYCGVDFTSSYETWLTMALDHVVPTSVCQSFNISSGWSEDCSNIVLACTACNSFLNRYSPPKGISILRTLTEFYSLRDRVFKERTSLIARKHEEEKAFFKSQPWKTK